MNKIVLFSLVLGLAAFAPAGAAALELHAFEFPERTPVELAFMAKPTAPAAKMDAKVVYRDGQAKIDLWYESMKPAILFGGDVTCYVLWAVTRDGDAENLGEMLARNKRDRLKFSTGKKQFALMVTAEPYYLVKQPSDLVVFVNTPDFDPTTASTAFGFDRFGPAVRRGMDSIANISWDAKVPLDLLQARKAFELATGRDAETHAAAVYAEAQAAVDETNELAAGSPRSRELLDTARRAVALSNEALNISAHRIEAIEVERKLAARRAETEALEQRAAQAEITAASAARAAKQAETLAETARLEVAQVRLERERMAMETAALVREKTELEGTMAGMRNEQLQLRQATDRMLVEKTALEQESRRLQHEKAELERLARQMQQERDELKERLQGALSHVAETRDSARGLVVNLPDILFDVNEATLKPEAALVLAKLSGILLVMPDQFVTIEGHTDATGSADYNLALSEQRARSVLDLIRDQGVDPSRLSALGFGMQRPVAENTTPDGRSKNRRVEIVISKSTQIAAN